MLYVCMRFGAIDLVLSLSFLPRAEFFALRRAPPDLPNRHYHGNVTSVMMEDDGFCFHATRDGIRVDGRIHRKGELRRAEGDEWHAMHCWEWVGGRRWRGGGGGVGRG